MKFKDLQYNLLSTDPLHNHQKFQVWNMISTHNSLNNILYIALRSVSSFLRFQSALRTNALNCQPIEWWTVALPSQGVNSSRWADSVGHCCSQMSIKAHLSLKIQWGKQQATISCGMYSKEIWSATTWYKIS